MASFSKILGQSWNVKFHKVKLLKFKTFNFDPKFCWNWPFFHYEKIMRFKKWPQLPGAGRTRAGHHHGSHTPTSPEAILLGKMAHHTKQIRRECINTDFNLKIKYTRDRNVWGDRPFYLVKQPQEKWACDFCDDALPLSFQLQVAEVNF